MSFDQPHTRVLNFSLFQIQAIAKKKFRQLLELQLVMCKLQLWQITSQKVNNFLSLD